MKKTFLTLFVVFTIFSIFSCLSVPETTEEPPVNREMSIQELILSGRSDEARTMFQSKNDINGTDEYGNTALHSAASIDDYDLIDFLLYMGADSSIKNMNGDTALHVAIKNNAVKSSEILAAIEKNIFAKDGEGVSALEMGIKKGSKFYDALITEKTGNIVDGQGESIVHYFVKWQNKDALNVAIKKRLPISVDDIYGISPLEICYENSNSLVSIQMAADLLLAGAAPQRGNFSYFEDSVTTRNPSLRFDDGQTPLHIATIQGQNGVVEYLINRGASTKAKDISGSTPLHEAVRYGRTEIANLLLKAGANPNAQDSLGKTPLLIISKQESRADIYSLLLTYGADANSKDMYGDTPLHIATMAGMKTSILEKLVNSGADINERNKKGVTPLSLAVEHQWTEHIDFYAKRGADIHAEDMEGKTPLSKALDISLEMTQKVINSNNCSTRDSLGNTPLHIAISRGASHEQIVYLITTGSDINARNRNGDSPLFLAVKSNLRAVGELLLAKGADVFATNTENYSPLKMAMMLGGDVQDWILSSEVIRATDGIGNTPLHYAAEWQIDSAVSVLLEKGANTNIQNSSGETPLFSAVKTDSVSTLRLLIQKGANTEIRDFLGNTALHSCVRFDSKNTALVLMSSGIDVNAQNLSGKTALHEAARTGKTAMVTLLLDNGANINSTDATGKTVLIDSIHSGNIELVKMLLTRGASPQIQEMYGRNAYHEAAEFGNIELITLIRTAGGNPLSRDTHGRTPFSLVLDKSDETIKAVLGNDINLSDSDGNTPIHIAVQNKVSSDKIFMLISMNYPLNRRNSLGLTPLTLAVKNNQNDLAKTLIECGADPFVTDNSGECAVSFAISDNAEVLNYIVQTTGNKKDMTGEGILHYAARTGDLDTIKKLLSMGLDRTSKNISGETPYDIAIRWQRETSILDVLK